MFEVSASLRGVLDNMLGIVADVEATVAQRGDEDTFLRVVVSALASLMGDSLQRPHLEAIFAATTFVSLTGPKGEPSLRFVKIFSAFICRKD